MSQKPLTFLVSLFASDQSLLTKLRMFEKKDTKGQLYKGVGTEGGGGCLCDRAGGWGVMTRRSPGVSN